MMKNLYILYIVLLPTMFSCGKENIDANKKIESGTDLAIQIAETTTAEIQSSEAIEEGYELFGNNDNIRIGLFSYDDPVNPTSLKAYNSRLGIDVKATYHIDSVKLADDSYSISREWQYGYGREDDYGNISFRKTLGDLPILAGCAPYRDAQDLMNIPYSATENIGWMWCTPVDLDTLPKPSDEGESMYKVNLKFHHTTAKLIFNTELKNKVTDPKDHTDNYWYLTYYPLRMEIATHAENELMKSATFDATKGVFKNPQYYGKDDFFNVKEYITKSDWDGVSNTKITKFTIEVYVVPGTTFSGLDFRMAVGYETNNPVDSIGTAEPRYITSSITPDILKSISGDAVLKAGYEYTFNMTLNNYLHLTGLSIKREWEAVEKTLAGNI